MPEGWLHKPIDSNSWMRSRGVGYEVEVGSSLPRVEGSLLPCLKPQGFGVSLEGPRAVSDAG